VLNSTINSPVGVAHPVGHVVLDHPDQMGIGGVEVLPGPGRSQQPFPPGGTADLRVDQDREESPVGKDFHHRQPQRGGGPPQQGRTRPGSQPPRVEAVEVAVGGQQLITPQPGVKPVARVFSPTE
jgi:hypothetical protein